MFRPLLIAAALVALPGTALAQSQDPAVGQPQAETGQPPQRIRSVTLTGAEACPKAAADEIVVCSRLDANEQFRVPKALRDSGPVPAANQSWVNRAAAIDQTGRVAAGLPNTCSAVGSGGQSGCAIQTNKAYAAERRAITDAEAAGTAQ